MGEPEKLSRKALEGCKDRGNELYLSVVSAWEMEIKQKLDRLRLKSPLRTIIEQQQEKNNLQILAVELEHVLALSDLPLHHADPFDRLLIAQAQGGGSGLRCCYLDVRRDTTWFGSLGFIFLERFITSSVGGRKRGRESFLDDQRL